MVPSVSPPTDNLYKFMAVFGLVLVIAGAVLAARGYERTFVSGVEALEELAAAEALRERIDVHEEFLDRATALRDSLALLRRQAASLGLDGDSAGVEGADSVVDSIARDLDRERRSLRVVTDEIPRIEASFSVQSRLARRMFLLGAALIFAGLGLAFSGFGLWWARVQRYEDEMIRVAALEAERRR